MTHLPRTHCSAEGGVQQGCSVRGPGRGGGFGGCPHLRGVWEMVIDSQKSSIRCNPGEKWEVGKCCIEFILN